MSLANLEIYKISNRKMAGPRRKYLTMILSILFISQVETEKLAKKNAAFN